MAGLPCLMPMYPLPKIWPAPVGDDSLLPTLPVDGWCGAQPCQSPDSNPRSVLDKSISPFKRESGEGHHVSLSCSPACLGPVLYSLHTHSNPHKPHLHLRSPCQGGPPLVQDLHTLYGPWVWKTVHQHQYMGACGAVPELMTVA